MLFVYMIMLAVQSWSRTASVLGALHPVIRAWCVPEHQFLRASHSFKTLLKSLRCKFLLLVHVFATAGYCPLFAYTHRVANAIFSFLSDSVWSDAKLKRWTNPFYRALIPAVPVCNFSAQSQDPSSGGFDVIYFQEVANQEILREWLHLDHVVGIIIWILRS